MKIAVDKGHNRGRDQGAAAIGNENKMNIATGDKVISKLIAQGHQVLDVISQIHNSVTVSQSLSKRVEIANKWGAELYVSIHANAGGGTGAEIWIGSEKGRAVAAKVCNQICCNFGYRNRGVKLQGVDGGHLYVLKNTKMTSILVEQCFVDSVEDMKRWDSENMANSIVGGITGKVIQTVQPVAQHQPKYDESIPAEVFKIPNTNGYIEQALDGRLIVHKDRGNYFAIGKGFFDVYWNDNNGHGGSKRISG